MADLKGLYAVLLTGGLIVAAAAPAGAAAVGEGHPLLAAAAESLADRAESEVVDAGARVAFVASGLDLGIGPLAGVLTHANAPVRRSGAASAAVEIASADSSFALTAAVHAMAGSVDLLSHEPRPADRGWVVPAAGPERPIELAEHPIELSEHPIVIIEEPVLTEAKPDRVENLLVSFLAAIGGIRDLMRGVPQDGIEAQ